MRIHDLADKEAVRSDIDDLVQPAINACQCLVEDRCSGPQSVSRNLCSERIVPRRARKGADQCLLFVG